MSQEGQSVTGEMTAARVLIVEPSGGIRDLLTLVVRGLGHEVVLDPDASPDDIDLLLVDTGESVGFGIARSVHAARPDLPVVVVSIYDQSHRELEFRPKAYVAMPFRLADLEGAISGALNGARS